MAIIAVDVRSLTVNITGIGRYTKELLDRLLSNSAHEWILYSDRPIIHSLVGVDSFRVRYGNCRGTAIASAYAQLQFPRWAKLDGVDLFWSPRHHLPLMLDSSVKTLLSIHDVIWKRCPESMRPMGRMLEQVLMPPSVSRADLVVAASQSTALDLRELLRCREEKIRVVYPGSTPARDRPIACMDQPYFLFVGTLEPRKNLPLLLRAYARLSRERLGAPRLLLAGGVGWGGQNIASLIADLGLTDQVRILGYVSDSELDQLYRGAAALLAPSLYEGFCLPLAEAIARGVPVLTSGISAMPEVAGSCGVLVDPMSEQDVYDGLVLLCEERNRTLFAAECSLHASKFTWEASASGMLEAIDCLLEG